MRGPRGEERPTSTVAAAVLAARIATGEELEVLVSRERANPHDVYHTRECGAAGAILPRDRALITETAGPVRG